MRVGSIKHLQAARKRLADGWNNTDHNYLRNQAVLITERMEKTYPPIDITGHGDFQSNAWATYEDKMRILKDKLQLTFLSFPVIE